MTVDSNIVRLPKVAEGETSIISVPADPPWRSILVTCQGGEYFAYWNVCRHLPVPLDGGTGVLSETPWVCMTHGATFCPNSGLCLSGPCEGDSLYSLSVEVLSTELAVTLQVPSNEEG